MLYLSAEYCLVSYEGFDLNSVTELGSKLGSFPG